MPGISSLVQLTTVRARPITAGDLRVTPESRILAVRLPFGGFVWHQPTGVVVERGGRTIQRLPIRDLTRIVQIAGVLATLVLTLVCLLAASAPSEA